MGLQVPPQPPPATPGRVIPWEGDAPTEMVSFSGPRFPPFSFFRRCRTGSGGATSQHDNGHGEALDGEARKVTGSPVHREMTLGNSNETTISTHVRWAGGLWRSYQTSQRIYERDHGRAGLICISVITLRDSRPTPSQCLVKTPPPPPPAEGLMLNIDSVSLEHRRSRYQVSIVKSLGSPPPTPTSTPSADRPRWIGWSRRKALMGCWTRRQRFLRLCCLLD